MTAAINLSAQSAADLPNSGSIGVVRPFRGRSASTRPVPGQEAEVADELRDAGRGDQPAFGRFYDRMAPVVYGIVLKVVRNPALAEEVTQEVFVELWRLAPRYDRSKGSPRAWSATIAHRRAVDRVRSEQAAHDRDQLDARHQARPHDSVTEEVVTRLDHEQVVAALGQLTKTQREAVTLAYYGGHTYRDVALLLDVPEGTVKTRIRDGLIKLRDLLEVTP